MIAVFLIFFLSLLYICSSRAPKKKYNLPPGPSFKLPILGHLPLLGPNPHQALLNWSSTYGPVISIQLGSFPAVVINDGKILKQAFSSPILAGRPRIKILDDWSRRRGIAFGDGTHCREQRRFAQKTLRDLTKPSELMETRILDETDDLIGRLEAVKGKPMSVHAFFNCNVINSLLGVLISKKLDPDDPQAEKLAKSLTSATQNNGVLSVLGTFIPALCSCFPDAVGHSLWMNMDKDLREFFVPFFQDHLETIIPGQPRDVLDIYVEKINDSKREAAGSSFQDVHNVEDAFRDLMGAGMETTSSQLEWIVYYMAKYPSVQEKLIEEVDSNLPQQRLPSFSDRPFLPYAEAVVQEALRISTITPFGLFHSALEDTEIAGYSIPKDTLVIGNLYAVNNDPNVWPNPREFRPERFLTQDGKFAAGDNPVAAFGTGQRSCIGEGLARNQLFLFTVRIFQNFRVRAISDELYSGHKFSVAVAPEPFQVVFERWSNKS